MIKQQPIKSNLRNSPRKIVKINGLNDITVSTQLITFFNIRVLFGRGKNNDWNSFRLFMGFHLCKDFNTINFRHFKIQQYHPGLILNISPIEFTFPKEEVQCLGPIIQMYQVVIEFVFS